MSVTFTWIIERMDCIPATGELSDVVITAYWRCSGTDGVHTSTVYGSCSFVQPGDPFIPYELLTELDVLGWCWAAGVDKVAQEGMVDAAIQDQVSPTVVSPPLPW